MELLETRDKKTAGRMVRIHHRSNDQVMYLPITGAAPLVFSLFGDEKRHRKRQIWQSRKFPSPPPFSFLLKCLSSCHSCPVHKKVLSALFPSSVDHRVANCFFTGGRTVWASGMDPLMAKVQILKEPLLPPPSRPAMAFCNSVHGQSCEK